VEGKKFHFGDVLSIITGRLVSPGGMGRVYDLLEFMTGKSLLSDELPKAMDECRPYLLKQHPYFDLIEIKNAVADLDKRLKGIENEERRREIVGKWLGEQVKKYSETIEVKPISLKV